LARKRMIDPSIWGSEDFSKLSYLARLIFIGMFSNADDEGRGKAKAAYLKSIICPYDENLRVADVDKALDEIASYMSVTFYTSNGNEYYDLYNWGKWQKVDRPQPSKIPPFDDACEVIRRTIGEQSANNRRTIPPNRKEENRKEEKRNICAFFEQLWSLYPVKKGKGSISDTQKQKLYKIGLDEMVRAINRYISEQQEHGTDIKYYKHGSTFFNSGYVDYLDDNYKPLPKTKKGNNNFEEREDIDFDEFEAEALKRRLNNG
jgi:hypothetical protein